MIVTQERNNWLKFHLNAGDSFYNVGRLLVGLSVPFLFFFSRFELSTLEALKVRSDSESS